MNKIALIFLLLMSSLLLANEKQVNNFAQDKSYYTVDKQGRIDKKTYNGWRRFGGCRGCHGPNLTGGTSGPNLLESITNQKMDFAAFVEIVSKGRLQKGMPAWGHDPNVNKYYADMYGYIRGRADGVIAEGRPKKIPKK